MYIETFFLSHQTFFITLAKMSYYASIMLVCYYAQNYASIIRKTLVMDLKSLIISGQVTELVICRPCRVNVILLHTPTSLPLALSLIGS